jgi:hypothetical protein
MLQKKSFTHPAYSISYKGRNSVLIKETWWKNNTNFVKNIPMTYVNVIVTVIMVSEKKIEITFVLPLI